MAFLRLGNLSIKSPSAAFKVNSPRRDIPAAEFPKSNICRVQMLHANCSEHVANNTSIDTYIWSRYQLNVQTLSSPLYRVARVALHALHVHVPSPKRIAISNSSLYTSRLPHIKSIFLRQTNRVNMRKYI